MLRTCMYECMYVYVVVICIVVTCTIVIYTVLNEIVDLPVLSHCTCNGIFFHA